MTSVEKLPLRDRVAYVGVSKRVLNAEGFSKSNSQRTDQRNRR
jgi:hypothetical protein